MRRYSVTTFEPGASDGFTHGFTFNPFSRALRATSPAPIITEGFVPMGKNEAQTVQMLKEFTAEIAPTFMRKETLSAAE